MAETNQIPDPVKVTGKGEIRIGFSDTVKVSGVVVRQSRNVSEGYQTVEEIIGENGELHSKIFSNWRKVISFTGVVEKGTTNDNSPKKGDNVVVTGTKYKFGSVIDVNVAESNTISIATGTIELFGTESTPAGE